MITKIESNTRGQADHGWLNSFHTFSFADYHNPNMIRFGPLRVINEDRILGGAGFDTHGHRDMEIVSYVVEGALEHKDSMGNSTLILPGEVQRMSAGTGIMHSEYNHIKDKTSHFLQIWILPSQMKINPSYGQKNFSNKLSSEKLSLVISPDASEKSIAINQDVKIYALKSKNAGLENFTYDVSRLGWIQVIKGKIQILTKKDNATVQLTSGDAISIQDTTDIEIKWSENSEFLLFDMINL
jgi:redox-sensitive bicupin YhaK (pirin superfamily)